MKNSLRLSTPMSVFIFALITAVLFSFVVFWGLQRKELEQLSKEELALSLDVEQLGVIGNWTLEYVKIDKAVDFLSEKKLSKDARRRLTEQLWQIMATPMPEAACNLALIRVRWALCRSSWKRQRKWPGVLDSVWNPKRICSSRK